MRIVLNGPVASGKSTLGKAIAEKYGLPFIEEDLTDIFMTRHAYQQLRKNLAPAEEILEAKRQCMRSFLEWKDRRAQQYLEHPEFVAERWDADLLDMWIFFWGRDQNVDKLTRSLFDDMQERARLIDLVVLLPFIEPFTTESSGPNLKRNTRFTSRLLNWTVISGLIDSVPNINVLRIPENLVSLDGRLELVSSRISQGIYAPERRL